MVVETIKLIISVTVGAKITLLITVWKNIYSKYFSSYCISFKKQILSKRPVIGLVYIIVEVVITTLKADSGIKKKNFHLAFYCIANYWHEYIKRVSSKIVYWFYG